MISLTKRLQNLRKTKGLSQKDMSIHLGISRSSYTQIELGNRSITVPELVKLSEVLQFSIDAFLSDEDNLDSKVAEITAEAPRHNARVSVPALSISKFKTVLLYLLEECAGKPNVSETVLYKLLYFCDFNHYEVHEEMLTGATYKKLPYGPVPQKLQGIIKDMIRDKQIQQIKTEYHGFAQTRYIPLERADLKLISGAEKESIDQVIVRYADWSASALSDYSHKDIPWKASESNGVIDYELAFYREAPFSARTYEND